MTVLRRLLLSTTLILASSCDQGDAETSAAAPTHVELSDEHPGSPGWIRLSDEARARLGIETAQVGTATPATRTVGGFVVDPPGGVLAMTAPLAGVVRPGDVTIEPGTRVEAGAVLLRLIPLAPADRDLRSQARRQRESTQARVEMTRARVERVRELLDSKASSARALEEAIAEMQVAEAEDRAAQARERALRRAPLDADVTLDILAPRDGIVRSRGAAPGQVVSAGAALLDLAGSSSWVRVPIYAGDRQALADGAPVRVAALGQPFATA
ncbi:MAG: HlyD family efflux transporter periplasmic adaptor subunit, partial [Myxococcales bacterium]|nr:HlyD family efflux transporter periplasmic adaptor subunit [Myxococcales bacterium]